jgi:pyridoxine/pyridoxamine 5'-phosphate oxidase
VDEPDLGGDPIAALQTWLDEARRVVPEPTAMTLATASSDGVLGVATSRKPDRSLGIAAIAAARRPRSD